MIDFTTGVLEGMRMNAIELDKILDMAHDVVDEEWKKVTPEQKDRMAKNIMKRADNRAKERYGDAD